MGGILAGELVVALGTHVVLLPLWILLWTGDAETAFLWFLLSRLAYVLFTGLALHAQDEGEWFTRRWGPEGGFRRFRVAVLALMDNDFITFMIVCWKNQGSLNGSFPHWAYPAVGIPLLVGSLVVKSWAVRTLGGGAFFWRSFFIPPGEARYVVKGPYRWFKNPMYTVGYAWTYGMALVLRSMPGLIGGLVAQTLVLLLEFWAERPHTERMKTRAAGPRR